MSSSFFPGWKELDLVEWVQPHKDSQLGHGGGRDNNTNASHYSQGGGGGTDFCDRPAAVNGSSSKMYAT